MSRLTSKWQLEKETSSLAPTPVHEYRSTRNDVEWCMASRSRIATSSQNPTVLKLKIPLPFPNNLEGATLGAIISKEASIHTSVLMVGIKNSSKQ